MTAARHPPGALNGEGAPARTQLDEVFPLAEQMRRGDAAAQPLLAALSPKLARLEGPRHALTAVVQSLPM